MSNSENPIVLNDKQNIEPTDLMSFNELCLKHRYNYDYLYKHSIIRGNITAYFRGTWKLSESEVLEFSRNVARERIEKIRANKGDF